MSDDARPRRKYDASKRQERAAATRARIIEAAGRVFLERGYAGATIPVIAAEAGVAVETVYRSTSGKAGLLASAVQAALAGGVERSERPVEARGGIRRVIEEAAPRGRLAAYAATQPGVWSRVGPLLRVLDAAAGTDAELTDLVNTLARQRLVGMKRFAEFLSSSGTLPPELPVDRAADLIWTICAQANYDALVTARGWSHEEYREWLTDMLVASLLPPQHDG